MSRRGRGIIDTLRAGLIAADQGELTLQAPTVAELQRGAAPPEPQLEAILGTEGPQTYRWWQTGLQRAMSVAAIRRKVGQRHGSGFLVRAGDLGLEPASELVVMTSFHVVDANGSGMALSPGDAEIVFDAIDPQKNLPNQHSLVQPAVAETSD